MKAGIDHPEVVDVVTYNEADDTYKLIISEPREWDGSDAERDLLLEKLNTYLSFAVDGQMERMYPESAGKSVVIQIDCQSWPTAGIENLLAQTQDALAQHGISVAIELLE